MGTDEPQQKPPHAQQRPSRRTSCPEAAVRHPVPSPGWVPEAREHPRLSPPTASVRCPPCGVGREHPTCPLARRTSPRAGGAPALASPLPSPGCVPSPPPARAAQAGADIKEAENRKPVNKSKETASSLKRFFLKWRISRQDLESTQRRDTDSQGQTWNRRCHGDTGGDKGPADGAT